MTLHYKLAFEIWAGIVVLVVAIGGVAGLVLLLDDSGTADLVRTQANNPSPTASPELSIPTLDPGTFGAAISGGSQ